MDLFYIYKLLIEEFNLLCWRKYFSKFPRIHFEIHYSSLFTIFIDIGIPVEKIRNLPKVILKKILEFVNNFDVQSIRIITIEF